MDTSEKQIKRIVLRRMERCGVCHRDFEPDDIHVISRKPDLWMMVVECDECHARNFVAAVLNDGDPDEAQLALRRLSEGTLDPTLAPARSDASPPRERVTANDVLNMHEFLGAFDGDFAKLFARS